MQICSIQAPSAGRAGRIHGGCVRNLQQISRAEPGHGDTEVCRRRLPEPGRKLRHLADGGATFWRDLLIIDLQIDPSVDETELEDLGNWLANEFELHGAVRRSSQPPETGTMGAVSNVLSMALAGGGTITVLAASLRVWFAQPRRSDIRLKITTSHGEVVELDAKRVNSAEALLKAMLARDAAAGLPAEGDDGAATRS